MVTTGHDTSPLSECMALLGGAWTPDIVWVLRNGPRRFGELRGDIDGVSAKVLSARLRRLAADGLVTRTEMPTTPPTVEYALTSSGRELLPAVYAIDAVGRRLKERQGSETPRSPRARHARPAMLA